VATFLGKFTPCGPNLHNVRRHLKKYTPKEMERAGPTLFLTAKVFFFLEVQTFSSCSKKKNHVARKKILRQENNVLSPYQDNICLASEIMRKGISLGVKT